MSSPCSSLRTPQNRPPKTTMMTDNETARLSTTENRDDRHAADRDQGPERRDGTRCIKEYPRSRNLPCARTGLQQFHLFSQRRDFVRAMNVRAVRLADARRPADVESGGWLRGMLPHPSLPGL